MGEMATKGTRNLKSNCVYFVPFCGCSGARTRAVPLKYKHDAERAVDTISLLLDFPAVGVSSVLSDFSRRTEEPVQRSVLADADRDFDLDFIGIRTTSFCVSYPISDTRSQDARDRECVTSGASRVAARSDEASGTPVLRSGDLDSPLYRFAGAFP